MNKQVFLVINKCIWDYFAEYNKQQATDSNSQEHCYDTFKLIIEIAAVLFIKSICYLVISNEPKCLKVNSKRMYSIIRI